MSKSIKSSLIFVDISFGDRLGIGMAEDGTFEGIRKEICEVTMLLNKRRIIMQHREASLQWLT